MSEQEERVYTGASFQRSGEFFVNEAFTRYARPAIRELWVLGFADEDQFGIMGPGRASWFMYYTEEEAIRWVQKGKAPRLMANAIARGIEQWEAMVAFRQKIHRRSKGRSRKRKSSK